MEVNYIINYISKKVHWISHDQIKFKFFIHHQTSRLTAQNTRMFGISAWKGITGFSQSLRNVRTYSMLGYLQPNEGSTTSYKRLGRGPASGKGKTSGRGQKGQKARGKVPRLFEGGQTPYWKRFPITGFKRPYRKEYHELNLTRIQEFWNHNRIPLEKGETLTIQIMKQCGLITGTMKDGVKILGKSVSDEYYSVPLNIEASKATKSAISKIERAGVTYSSVYHSKLGLRVHLDPENFLLKKGYIPLQARPIHKRDINYYSNPEKNGYLLKDTSLLLDYLNAGTSKKVTVRKNALESQLENASTKSYSDYHETKTIEVSKL